VRVHAHNAGAAEGPRRKAALRMAKRLGCLTDDSIRRRTS